MTTTKEKIENGLIKMAMGLNEATSVYNLSTKESDLLEDIINSEVGEGYVQEKYTELFQFSFDEEALMFCGFVSDYTDEDIDEMDGEVHLYQALDRGLSYAIEGLEEIIEACKHDKEEKNRLKSHVYYDTYQPFKQYGFYAFLKKLKGFRWAYKAELSKQIGKREYQKIMKQCG